MLAYVAHRGNASQAVGDRVDGLAGEPEPLVRSSRALVDMALTRTRSSGVRCRTCSSPPWDTATTPSMTSLPSVRARSRPCGRPASDRARGAPLDHHCVGSPIPDRGGCRVRHHSYAAVRRACRLLEDPFRLTPPYYMSPTSVARPPPSSAAMTMRSWLTSKPWSSVTSTTVTTTWWASCSHGLAATAPGVVSRGGIRIPPGRLRPMRRGGEAHVAPMLCGLVIVQALRQQNLAAMHEAVDARPADSRCVPTRCRQRQRISCGPSALPCRSGRCTTARRERGRGGAEEQCSASRRRAPPGWSCRRTTSCVAGGTT